MDEDDNWDLHAVVRGCAAAVAASKVTTMTAPAAAAANNHPFPHLHSSFPYQNDQNSFDFPGLVDDRNDPFQGVLEINQDFCFDDPPPTSAAGIMSAPPPLVLQPHQHIMQVRPPLPIQENVQFNINISPTQGSPLQNSIPQPIRPRRRKNQQMKLVRQMTQEELSADSWAWRKYGQKPIKGSPYPRNYYRCSTSKGCSARKQVERSPNDPEVFVVSYSGEHTHPRPTHRSSLAGSTRSKFASPPPKSGGSGAINTIISQKGAVSSSSSSSPAAGSSFSPATPSMEAEAAAQNDDVHMAEEVDDGDDDDDNVIMIPNDLMNDDDDDIFRAFQDSDDHSSGGGCDFFSYGLVSSPPWTPTSSTGNASTLHGGGS